MVPILVGVLACLSGLSMASFTKGRVTLGILMIIIDVMIVRSMQDLDGIERTATYIVIVLLWIPFFIIGALVHIDRTERRAAKRRSKQKPRGPH